MRSADTKELFSKVDTVLKVQGGSSFRKRTSVTLRFTTRTCRGESNRGGVGILSKRGYLARSTSSKERLLRANELIGATMRVIADASMGVTRSASRHRMVRGTTCKFRGKLTRRVIATYVRTGRGAKYRATTLDNNMFRGKLLLHLARSKLVTGNFRILARRVVPPGSKKVTLNRTFCKVGRRYMRRTLVL